MGRDLIHKLEAAINLSNLNRGATPPGVAPALSADHQRNARLIIAPALLLICICFHALCHGVLEYRPYQ
jgi:hypothetical protein